MIPGQVPTISLKLRKELIDVLGDAAGAVMEAADHHMMDAMSTILLIHRKHNCIDCFRSRIWNSYLNWINNEGYKLILDGTEEAYDEFMRGVVLWTLAWSRKQADTICCDASPSKMYN